MIKPLDPFVTFGPEINLSTSLEPEAPSDAVSWKNGVRIVVPRIARVADPPNVHARLLAAAAEHLRHVGPRCFILRAAADELGMARASVYRHFSSKAALLDAVVGCWLSGIETDLVQITNTPDSADDKIEYLLTTLASIQRDAQVYEPNLFAAHLNATVRARLVAKRHRVRLRSLVERVLEEGIAAGIFVVRNREQAIAYVFDASYRFTHPLAIQQDADLPRDLVEARLSTVILVIQTVLRTGTL